LIGWLQGISLRLPPTPLDPTISFSSCSKKHPRWSFPLVAQTHSWSTLNRHGPRICYSPVTSTLVTPLATPRWRPTFPVSFFYACFFPVADGFTSFLSSFIRKEIVISISSLFPPNFCGSFYFSTRRLPDPFFRIGLPPGHSFFFPPFPLRKDFPRKDTSGLEPSFLRLLLFSLIPQFSFPCTVFPPTS